MTLLDHRPATLGLRAEQALERLGDGPSLFFEGTWHTAGELAGRARRVAAGLAGLGVQPGDRVVLCMTNCPEVGIAYAALWRAGAVPTPVLFLLTEPELRHVISDSGAKAVITTPEWLPKIQAAAPGLPVVVVGGDGAPGTVAFEELESADELPLVSRDVDDMAALLYTGGTTGRSKGVVLTHTSLDTAGAAGMAASYQPGRTRGILPLPLAHAYGLMVSVAGLHARERGASVLMRWFDPAGFLDLVEEHRVQTAALVPSMIQMLLTQPLEERRLGSVGKPIPAIELRIEGPDGEELEPGEDGEIVVRGPVLMQGYWQAPEETARAVRDGWWHSGDVGHLDEEGWLYVVDRLKDLIIRNGFNVYPRDVEDVLLAHPDVTAAAVVGRPDPKVGEEVVAFVSLHAGATVTPEQLVEHSRQHLSAAKYPRQVRIVDTVPVTSVFKTDRKALRALMKEESA